MNGFLDERDSAHNNAFMAIACLLNGRVDEGHEWMERVENELFKSIIWPIKNDTYHYSNSEGFTKWLFDNVLKPWDPHKGTNPDQCEPCNVWWVLTGNHYRLLRFMLGLCLRLGFFPNGEHIAFKLSHLAPIARFYHLAPLYWILDAIAYISFIFDIEHSRTTTKIRHYLYMLAAEKQPTYWTKRMKRIIAAKHGTLERYYSNVFFIYFHEDGIIYKTMPYNKLEEPC